MRPGRLRRRLPPHRSPKPRRSARCLPHSGRSARPASPGPTGPAPRRRCPRAPRRTRADGGGSSSRSRPRTRRRYRTRPHRPLSGFAAPPAAARRPAPRAGAPCRRTRWRPPPRRPPRSCYARCSDASARGPMGTRPERAVRRWWPRNRRSTGGRWARWARAQVRARWSWTLPFSRWSASSIPLVNARGVECTTLHGAGALAARGSEPAAGGASAGGSLATCAATPP